MCKCIENIEKEVMLKNPELKNYTLDVDMFSGRLFVNATYEKEIQYGRSKGKTKQKSCPMLLSKCPFCSEDYII